MKIDGCTICGVGGKITRGFCRRHYLRWLRNGDPLAGRVSKGEPAKFLAQAIKSETDDCIIWPFCKSRNARIGTKNVCRMICEELHGPAPNASHYALHSCGKGADGCINPRHIHWGTPKENTADRIKHGTHGYRLKEHQVVEIRKYKDRSIGAEKQYGISRVYYLHIINGHSWNHIK